ncbi:helix-turn-helix domain-containing protein [Marinobacter persicus]|jgi:transposase|uniref:Helix-turn-helix protein n=1 Tax=Marinobacter persicus TaxID=930118 RepID=A0A2S6G663_9GAMM|nr:helix-turn-helix transcriptional regulator [Marinobacter persicus]PPK51376.1 helix-turn-helix protein [Marinobacter persicus]PPK54629.1 helix-turn-helix protein [Marinobacter persicus]PPK58055.1 helix-turn-helix protein [Marinobacter persicus]
MLAADMPAQAMLLSTYHFPAQQVVAGAPPLSTLATDQPNWPESERPGTDWQSVRVVSDAANNAVSTVHVFTQRPVAAETQNGSASITAASMIASAQTVTGLSLKDLAAVYGVSRQTLYNYKKQKDQPSDANWQRLQRVDKAIGELKPIFPASPGALAKRVANEQGDTLLLLLQQKKPNLEQLKALAHQLADQMNSTTPAKRHQSTLDELTRHC